MLFRRISLYFMTGFCIFGEQTLYLEIVLKTMYIFFTLGMWECSSVVEQSTADLEVGGSIPFAPFFITIGYLSKDVRHLKDLFSSLFSTTKAQEYCFFVELHFDL